MRVLFTPFPVRSHVYNLVPLAWALRAAGHEVRFAVRPNGVDMVTGAGLTAVPVGDALDFTVVTADHNPYTRRGDADGLPGMRQFDLLDHVDRTPPGSAERDWGKPFLHTEDRLMDDLLAATENWRPDLVLWDTMVFAGPVAARVLGVPHMRVLFALDLLGWYRARMAPNHPDGLRTLLGDALGRFGADFSEDVAVGHATVEQTPRWMRLPVDLEYVPVRFVPHNGPAVVPRWLHEPPARPRVCVCLGHTRRNLATAGDGFRELVDRETEKVRTLLLGAAGLDVEVIATLGADEAAAIGPLPGNVRIHEYVPLHELLRTCSVIIHHGGGSTQETATVDGVPQLVLPGGYWDEPRRARLLAERGAALVLDPGQLTEAGVRDRLTSLLTDPSFAAAAAAIRQETRRAPTPHDIVPRLERLAVDHAPAHSSRSRR